MSKIFEALKRLERESGTLSSDFANDAQVVFEGPAFEEHAAVVADSRSAPAGAPADDLGPGFDVASAVFATSTVDFAPPEDVAAEYAPTIFSLEQLPAENAVITAESRIVLYTDPHGAGADRFRLLKMRLQSAWEKGRLRKLLITSPLPAEGKSTVALNLATALAEQGKRTVLLIEGDLRRPMLCSRLGLRPGPGLAECLESGCDLISVLRRIEPLGWYLLPAGQVQGNPTELLQSEGLSSVIQAVSPCFDWIVIDSPPATPLADVPALKAHADASLLVVRAASTSREAIEAAIARLGSKHILGMILNGAEQLDQLYSKYY
ncbi:MAG TPA: CpsD/CapB family tyrosine-protein kinase [Bryobacteraceae bacterium]|nr:CpsD/CapB family tyrosine-protein kinase [Bryobacteraceae bacterium]